MNVLQVRTVYVFVIHDSKYPWREDEAGQDLLTECVARSEKRVPRFKALARAWAGGCEKGYVLTGSKNAKRLRGSALIAKCFK